MPFPMWCVQCFYVMLREPHPEKGKVVRVQAGGVQSMQVCLPTTPTPSIHHPPLGGRWQGAARARSLLRVRGERGFSL